MTTQTNIQEVMELVEAGISLTNQQASVYLNLSERTLEKYRITGEGPCFCRYGKRTVRYPILSLNQWKNARLYNSTSEEVKK